MKSILAVAALSAVDAAQMRSSTYSLMRSSAEPVKYVLMDTTASPSAWKWEVSVQTVLDEDTGGQWI